MSLHLKTLLSAAGILALTACSQGTMAEFYAEAGAELDEGGFGNPTMNNMMAHINARCAGRAKGYIVPDPIVVLDPNSPHVDRPYRVGNIHCPGPLNGKYAEVIWTEYVASATEFSTIETADASGEGTDS